MKRLSTILIVFWFALLTSCGGGGIGSIAGGGIGGTGISQGAVTGFGSVIVNGTEYDTSDANIMINGQAATQADLQIGFIVRVEGDLSAGLADEVSYSVSVLGSIEALNLATGSLTVLGQTVLTNAVTNFRNTPFDDLNVGDIVGVSGNRNAADQLVASFIHIPPAPLQTQFRVIGTVRNVSGTRFTIANLTVDFSSANLNGLPSGSPTPGQLVEVIGPSTGFSTAPATLVASQVNPATDLNAAVGDELELEGIITRFNSSSDFEVNGQRVNTDSSTVFEDGTPAALGLNVQLEVEGVIDNNGVLQADRVEIERESSIRIDANADAVSASAGTVTLLGITVQVTGTTRLDDQSDTDIRSFSVADINPGDRIEMRGFLRDNEVIATRLGREDPDDRVELSGPVEDVNQAGFTLTVLGTQIFTDNDTEFEGSGGGANNRDAFFTAVSPGSLVRVRWEPFVSINDPADGISLEE